MPTIDVHDIQIGYPNIMVLMEHLGRMGEGNACLNERRGLVLEHLWVLRCLYNELCPAEDQGDGNIVASAQIIYAIAWKEHETQQKPLERGTAKQK
ncbi:hypothetical protein ACHAXM_000309 [Skeletonema potamos]|jgi:NADH dehydrogenase [ubiquinone] 1 alpha subcomplex assembly factor 5